MEVKFSTRWDGEGEVGNVGATETRWAAQVHFTHHLLFLL